MIFKEWKIPWKKGLKSTFQIYGSKQNKSGKIRHSMTNIITLPWATKKLFRLEWE